MSEIGLAARPRPTVYSPLPQEADAGGYAREALARIRFQLDSDIFDDVQLLTTELVTNAVRHGGNDADLSVWVNPEYVRVEVSDSGAGFDPPGHEPMHRGPHGWGLRLVNDLSDGWGVSRGGGRTRVWFEMAREPGV